jgi:hypothetical protein
MTTQHAARPGRDDDGHSPGGGADPDGEPEPGDLAAGSDPGDDDPPAPPRRYVPL